MDINLKSPGHSGPEQRLCLDVLQQVWTVLLQRLLFVLRRIQPYNENQQDALFTFNLFQ